MASKIFFTFRLISSQVKNFKGLSEIKAPEDVIILTEEEIEILDKDKVVYSSKYTDIENYNTYYFINKKGGYVLRFSGGSNFFCSLLTWTEFTKASDIDYENYDVVVELLSLSYIFDMFYLSKIFNLYTNLFYFNLTNL